MPQRPEVAVLGAGSFGTALALVIAAKQEPVLLWGRDVALMDEIARTRRHPSRLDQAEVPTPVEPTHDLEAALQAKVLIHTIPAQHTRGFWAPLAAQLPADTKVLLASKGIEQGTGKRLDEVFADLFGAAWVDRNLAALSGPTFAKELARRVPTAALVAARSDALAQAMQHLVAAPFFRLYRSTDLVGIEVAGAVKNVVAIAAGIGDGMALGHNPRAGIVTRGLAEITRFGMAQGAQQQTFLGLAGVGDLILTATGDLSRNRTLGRRLGQGETLADIRASMREVAEGVPTTASTLERARALDVEMPITEQVGKILFEDKDPAQAVFDLMTRTLKRE